MAQLFGFSIKDEDLKKGAKAATSPVPPTDNDASSTITPYGGWFGHYVDLDDTKKRDEINLIRRYREMALAPEVDSAIEDVTNEAINLVTLFSIIKIYIMTKPSPVRSDG